MESHKLTITEIPESRVGRISSCRPASTGALRAGKGQDLWKETVWDGLRGRKSGFRADQPYLANLAWYPGWGRSQQPCIGSYRSYQPKLAIYPEIAIFGGFAYTRPRLASTFPAIPRPPKTRVHEFDIWLFMWSRWCIIILVFALLLPTLLLCYVLYCGGHADTVTFICVTYFTSCCLFGRRSYSCRDVNSRIHRITRKASTHSYSLVEY